MKLLCKIGDIIYVISSAFIILVAISFFGFLIFLGVYGVISLTNSIVAEITTEPIEEIITVTSKEEKEKGFTCIGKLYKTCEKDYAYLVNGNIVSKKIYDSVSKGGKFVCETKNGVMLSCRPKVQGGEGEE